MVAEQITMEGTAIEPWRGFYSVSVIEQTLGASKPPKALRDSIEREGVLIPVVLHERGPGTKARIVDGRRRIAAARVVGIEAVPAVVYPVDWLGNPLAMTVSLNELRWESEHSETQAILELAEQGMTEKTITAETGMPVARVRKRLSLAKLIPALMDAFADGAFPASVAEAAAKLSPEQQERLAGSHREGERITGTMVSNLRRVAQAEAASSMPTQLVTALAAQPPTPPGEQIEHNLRSLAREAVRLEWGQQGWLEACRDAFDDAKRGAEGPPVVVGRLTELVHSGRE